MVDPQVSLSVLGSGGGVGGMSTSRTARVERGDLDLLLIAACETEAEGVMVAVDEIQKLSEDDVSVISNAFQMASRKGMNAMLVVAGLPASHEEVIRYQGCTFMRRATHERLTLLERSEVVEAFEGTLSRVGIVLDDQCLGELVSASYGHPYLVQLLGYYLVQRVGRRGEGPLCASMDDIRIAKERAVAAYTTRALEPMVAELSPAERAYLRSVAQCLDEGCVAHATDIAQRLGKDAKQMSAVRASLLKGGILLAPQRGQLVFSVPHLADYVQAPPAASAEVERVLSWGV